jgi:hypothetical protein
MERGREREILSRWSFWSRRDSKEKPPIPIYREREKEKERERKRGEERSLYSNG